MNRIAVGCDVSKGRCDIAIINESGSLLAGSGGYDDTRTDHERLRGIVLGLRERYPHARVIVGLESTGGLERNWLAFFQSEKRWRHFVSAHCLNPLAVKRYLASDLHRAVSDASAARGIAQLMLERYADRPAVPVALDGSVTLYRTVRTQIVRRVETYQRLQALLVSVHPDLVQYCRARVPDWVLAVIEHYPTARHLARGSAVVLERLPHIDAERAGSLLAAAKASVAALTDEGAAEAMRLLVGEIRDLDAGIGRGQSALERMLGDDPRVKRLDGMPGIGPWSAIALVLEIGDVTRFRDVRSLIAWSGLDPHEDVSGDGVIRRGISHRGNAHLRAMLYPLALVASQHNPVVAPFYQRLRERGKTGKVALVACCAKILRIVYALLISGQEFNADHESDRAAAKAQLRQQARAKAPEAAPPAPSTPTLSAPVTAREAKRRRAAIEKNHATAPSPRKCEVEPHAGSGAVAPASIPTSCARQATTRRSPTS